ncbi:uncharacterized protein [Nicotiana sylvestris]|uniref:uncharacterized protein n=1 Tax=Nicotiana sylvestris TaxID=4096 RepID=UPI00388C88AC
MPTGRLAKWQILLTEFDIIYVTRTAMKAQALADHLAENPVDEDYEPLKIYFPDEEVMHIDELKQAEKPGWKLFFDGAANMKCVGIGAVLISETGQHYPITARLRFYCTNNMAEYEAIEFRNIPRMHNEVADALTTLASMLHHPDKAYVDPLQIQVRDQHAYCNVIEEETDGEPWFHDIQEYIKVGVYPTQTTDDQKRTIRRLASGFFFSEGVLYKITLDLGVRLENRDRQFDSGNQESAWKTETYFSSLKSGVRLENRDIFFKFDVKSPPEERRHTVQVLGS